MKLKIFILFFVPSFVLTIYSQGRPAGELNIHILDNYEDYEFRMDLISPLSWDADPIDPNLHNISDEYNSAVVITSAYARFFMTGFWAPPLDNDFGLGLYKVSIVKNQQVLKYFYIDYRTSDLIENFNGGPALHGDIFLDYEKNTNKLYYEGTQIEFPQSGNSTTIWDEKEWIQHLTTEFEPLPPENFNLASSGGHPYLTWNHSSNTGDYWTGYKIYRDICAGGNPYFTEDNWIATIGKYTTGYIDPTYFVGHGWEGYYCVKAINGSRGSDFSEVLEIGIDAFGKDREEIQPEAEFCLIQNYPNPFNPVTNIKYSISGRVFTTLKVYDILGNEVASLVNEMKESGNYSVEFNAANLPSGIYVYKITAGNFVATKKLILLK